MDRGWRAKKEKHPRETSNLLSIITFFYIIKLFKKGYTKGLEADDVYEVLPNCRSKDLGDKLEKHWNFQKTKTKNPSLCVALCLCFGKTFITLGIIQLIAKLTMTIWSPQAQSKLISYFSPQSEQRKSDAIYYACVVIGLKIFNLFFTHNFALYVLALGLGAKAAVVSLLYRKLLNLPTEALSQVTVGKITTLLNKDVEIIQSFLSGANDIWIALVQTGMICYLIYSNIGIASWAGVTFFFLVLQVQMFIGKLTYNFRLKCSKKTDERLEITREVLSSIKIIKMYTWEKYFEKKIRDARNLELKKMVNIFYARVFISVIGSISSKVAFFIFLMTYIWMNNNVTAEIVYYMLSCFNDLQSSLSGTIPSGFSSAAETYAVIKRCEDILNLEEAQVKKKELDIPLQQGLHVITGRTGAGKSTFLKKFLQNCEGSVSYASQDPWIFPSTIRNNIIFGEEYCEKRYQEVLKIYCSLDYDLALIDDGDGTIIGDHGINLSKGQQARVNLARAVYRNSDIYLLDDCLASLDANVSDHIFKHYIRKFLQNKICLFVTNNLDYVQEADQVITIDEGAATCSTNINKKVYYEENQERNEDTTERVKVYVEKKNPGKVSLRDYYKYVCYGGGIIVFGSIMLLFIASQATSSYSEKLISSWVTLEQNFTNLKEAKETGTPEYEELSIEKRESLTKYCIIFATFTLLHLISSFLYFFFVKTASINMHQAMLRSIMNTKMTFFDSNYIGNILTRFSKDCWTTDEIVPFFLKDSFLIIFEVIGAIILLTTLNTIFLVESIILIIIAYLIKRVCQPTGRNCQRLHVIARSPMVGHVNSTLTGLTTIRAARAEKTVIDEFDRYQNQFTSAHYMLDNSLIALSFSLELFCTLFITSVIIQVLVTDTGSSVGDVGLAITQSFLITSIISKGIRTVSDCENLMTSVERILEYVCLDQEDRSGLVLENWPRKGSIDFDSVTLKNILKDINLSIKPSEKLGIVARTGAGKSSIISSLFRLYQTQGKITIDGIDIDRVALSSIRGSISVIPQDPFLFSGTIRDNLDPLKHHTDEEIWKVLSDLHLENSIEDLCSKIDLSVGQKQLLCLARVILRKTKIVILDEATANIDPETDASINETVRKNFDKCTVIIVAHRLLSVIDCDKVVVMSNGEIKECDEPKKLLENKQSLFYSVVK